MYFEISNEIYLYNFYSYIYNSCILQNFFTSLSLS
ncbi:hypothetical protein HMPREF1022_02238, partial [Desulfovibrio sp. 6_1_46AFAA]